MDPSSPKLPRKVYILIASLLTGGIFLIAVLYRRWSRNRDQRLAMEKTPQAKINLRKFNGLSEEQADRLRIEGLDNTLFYKPRRTRREIWRENVLSIFNLSLVGLAGVQLFFGKPLDSLISIGVLCLNIGLNVFQENFARMRIKDVLQKTHPRVTGIRDGKTRSIDANDIVVGDIVAFGPGDELFADGMLLYQDDLVIDESMLGVGERRAIKESGEFVFAGSYCVSGRAVYQVQKVGQDRLITTLIKDSQESRDSLTPIEEIVNNVLKLLLVVVAVFTVFLINTYLNLNLPIPEDAFNEIAGIVFGLAPAGLFFMIIVTYAGSTVDLARIGALVNRARSVETMAQVNTICFSREGILTSMRVEMEPILLDGGDEIFPEDRLRQILGDYARTTSNQNPLMRSITNTFEGNKRQLIDEAPFLSVFGWNAITFSDPDLEGVYVLGVPAALEPYLAKRESDPDLEAEEEPGQVRKLFSRFGGLLNRSSQNSDRSVEGANGTGAPISTNQGLSPSKDVPHNQEGDEARSRPGLIRRFLTRLSTREDSQTQETRQQEAQTIEGIELLFTYYPQPTSLINQDGKPQFPTPLIPLCSLKFEEQLRSDTLETIKKFVRNGIDLKIFTEEQPQQVADVLTQVGLEGIASNMVSGRELAAMTAADRIQSTFKNTTFLHLSPQQMGEVVDVLKSRDQYVAVIGNSVNDLPAMRAANLALAYHHSSQAAQSVADILLLENSSGVIEKVLDKGQRIVNGLLDILKLYLTQVFYVILLIAFIQVIGFGFPFRGIHLSVISIVSITIPSLGLTLWAQPGILHKGSLRRSLTHFVIPAAVTISLAATYVYFYFQKGIGENQYAHLTVTYALVFMGLLVVLFLRPPTRLLAGGSPVSDDRRITFLVLALFVLFIIFLVITVSIPFLQETLFLNWLDPRSDYMIVTLVVITWAIALQAIWRIWRLNGEQTNE